MDNSAHPASDIPSDRQEPVASGRRPPALTAVEEVEFIACYQAEMPELIRFLIKFGAKYHDAAEAAQEAFMELYRQWRSVNKRRPWLRRVALRIYLKSPVRADLALEGHDKSGVLSASSRIEIHEEEQAVLTALQALPMTQRAVLALHYDQLETREIAKVLEMKEAAVRKNLERARASLKQFLGLTQYISPMQAGISLGEKGREEETGDE